MERLAALKISEIKLKYATFLGSFFYVVIDKTSKKKTSRALYIMTLGRVDSATTKARAEARKSVTMAVNVKVTVIPQPPV